MRSTTPIPLTVLLSSAVLLSACASVSQPPTGALAQAKYAIAQASQTVGQSSQSAPLNEAKARYEHAQKLVANPKATEENYTQAGWLAEEATLDARLAQAQAQAQQTESQKTDLQKSYEKMHKELDGKESK